jgi:hypothetical protein
MASLGDGPHFKVDEEPVLAGTLRNLYQKSLILIGEILSKLLPALVIYLFLIGLLAR